jgi:hypothetical protein
MTTGRFFVVDMISGNKTRIYETPDRWSRENITEYVKATYDFFQDRKRKLNEDGGSSAKASHGVKRSLKRPNIGVSMSTNVLTAPDLVALVKRVRALLRKKQWVQAMMLVRERAGYGLKEAKEFVDHVKARSRAKAENIAELWMRVTADESIANTPEPAPQPAATPKEESMKARESTDAKGISWPQFYEQFMKTHTYSEWAQLIDQIVASKQAEDQPGYDPRGADVKGEEL